jgi:glycosyltransferase involved in cell wall biosynthesis
VGDEDLAAIYNLATVYCQPSFYEGFGFPPLEAMACGTPVITSCVSSLPEVTGEVAVLVNPHNVEELAEAMRRVILDAGLRETLARKGIANASRFTWSRSIQETIRVYERVCP